MMWSYKHLSAAILGFITILTISLTCHGFELTILHTNDVHARVQEMNAFGGQCSPDKDCFGGAARMRTKIEALRGEHPNTLLLDAGDQFQGTLWFTHYGGRVTYTMMNLLGYDVMVIFVYIYISSPFSLLFRVLWVVGSILKICTEHILLKRVKMIGHKFWKLRCITY